MKKLILPAFVVFSSLLTFTACTDSSENILQSNKDGVITSVTDPDFDAANLKGDVTGNITLKASTSYVLSGPLRVKNGATLTVEAGTTVKAVAGGSDVFVSIEQGAKIEAKGTATAPIKFTSNSSSPKSGDWGGIVVVGKATTNKGNAPETEIAGLTYGGSDDADSSGTLSYVVAEYTGARINGEKEFNGFSLYSVGSGTTINNIAVFNGDDDGIEFFGGTADITNALVVNAKDDALDWTDGWRGTATNVALIRENGFDKVTDDPRGIEGDSNGSDNLATPVSAPIIKDLTIVSDASIKMSDMIKVRRGSKVTITNALVGLGATAEASDFVDLEDGKGDASSASSIEVQGVNIDENDIKNKPSATIVKSTSATGSDNSKFAWTKFDFTKVNSILGQ